MTEALYWRLDKLREQIELPKPFGILCTSDGFQLTAWLPDAYTGEERLQASRLYEVSMSDSDSQIVRAMFGAYLAFVEHEARETFKYRGARIFGPHLDVEALVEIADRVDHS